MDKTYFYIFKILYKHLYKFCLSGNAASKDEVINSLGKEVKDSKDIHLGLLYDIVSNAIDVKYGKEIFLQKAYEYEVSLAPDDYLNRWCLHSILSLIYKYIYPDSEKVAKSETEITIVADELASMDGGNYQLQFEDADYTIQMHIKKEATMYSAYTAEYEEQNFKLKNRSFMTILKGYSSSTPFFYPALKERYHNIPIKGGGIYIKWNGTGLVIDPGINFMENLHMVGLTIKDIDAIIVTHNHIDHNGDLAIIDDLASQLNKKDIFLYMDKDTEEEFSGRLVNFSKKNRHGLDLAIRTDYDFFIGSKKDIYVKAIPTKHILENEKDYVLNETYAVKIHLRENGKDKAVIGFTSDTIYLPELSDEFKTCDYVVANISETDYKDYFKKEMKMKHLGYSGCLKLIQECNSKRGEDQKFAIVAGKPRYIISEFWAGKGDVRKELIKRLRQESGYEYIYPGDIGMLFFLDQPSFLCGFCESERDLEQLHVLRSKLEYSSFSNICNECILI